MQINVKDLSLYQLKEIDFALEEYIFRQPIIGEEPFSPTFRKDPKTFRKLIRELVSFKRDLMTIFSKMYHDRWTLLNYHALPTNVRFDEYDQYFYEDYWKQYNQELAKVIEKHKKQSYTIGLLSLMALMGLATNLTAEDAQKKLTNQSLKYSSLITKVTQERIKKQIEAALKLGEDKTAFEERLKNIFLNQSRGRLIAEDQALNSWSQARVDMAIENDLQYRTLTGSQTDKGEMCGQIIGETVPINQPYSNGLMHPQFHLRCRCGEEFSNSK